MHHNHQGSAFCFSPETKEDEDTMKPTKRSHTFFAALAAVAITFSLAVSSQAQTVIYNYPDGYIGGDPESRLVADPAGNLYGVTLFGGSDPSVCDSPGSLCGTVFELSPASGGTWTYSVLHEFSGNANGGKLIGGLAIDPAGNLYGTTAAGGDLTECNGSTYLGSGCGVVFKLSKNSSGHWQETILHTFTGGTDGGNPISSLIIDAAGNLYGTTQFGGSTLSKCGTMGCGVAFRISHASTGWHETVLRAFDFSVDGQYPRSLVQDSAGNIYGASFQGPNYVTCSEGCGLIWRLSPTASGPWTETILYTFLGGSDGANPAGGMILDSAGNLYGTTEQGGSSGDGTVFELSPTTSGPWTETQLHVFTGPPDGMFPTSAPVFDQSGNILGTTAYGGALEICSSNGCGTMYEFSPAGGGSWSYRDFIAFTGDDGYTPNGIIVGPDGNIYGSAQGGNLGYGILYEVPW
jgi:uncharacterized repeat protein (TIGR03803 family)